MAHIVAATKRYVSFCLDRELVAKLSVKADSMGLTRTDLAERLFQDVTKGVVLPKAERDAIQAAVLKEQKRRKSYYA